MDDARRNNPYHRGVRVTTGWTAVDMLIPYLTDSLVRIDAHPMSL